MPVNATNPATVDNHNHKGHVPANDSATKSKGNQFNQQVQTNKTNTALQNVVGNSGLKNLANDADSWHSLMGQTYGYDQTDTEGQAYEESEALRTFVLGDSGDWQSQGISIVPVTGDEAFEAAFVGGDTADAGDDQILINKNIPEGSEQYTAAITEELFHAFERKINPDQEGDTRLVNGEAIFTNDETAGALDEGELGRTLLAAFKESGEVPTGTAFSDLLATGEITVNDTSIVSLNGEGVSVEFTDDDMDSSTDPIGGIDASPMLYDEDPIGYVKENDSESVNNQFYNAVQDTNLTAINDYFTDDFAVLYAEAGTYEGQRDYSAMSGFYDEVIADTSSYGGTTDMVGFLINLDNPLKSGTQGIQDLLGYSARHHPTVASDITEKMSDGAGAAFLNQFSYEELNNESTGFLLNPEVLQHFPAEELLSLDDNKIMSAAVQDALGLKIDNDDYAFPTLSEMHDTGLAEKMSNLEEHETSGLNSRVIDAMRDHDEELRGNNHTVGGNVRTLLQSVGTAAKLFQTIASNMIHGGNDGLLHTYDHSEYAHFTPDVFERSAGKSWFSDGLIPRSLNPNNIISSAVDLFDMLKNTLITATDIPGDRDYHYDENNNIERMVVGVDPAADDLINGRNIGDSGPTNAIKYVFERVATGGNAWALITSFPYWSNNLAAGNTAEDPYSGQADEL